MKLFQKLLRFLSSSVGDLNLFGIKTARSCHSSVRLMDQADERATKRGFGEIMLLVTDCLIFAGLTVFSPVTGLYYILIAVLLQELIVFSLQVTSLLCVYGLFR